MSAFLPASLLWSLSLYLVENWKKRKKKKKKKQKKKQKKKEEEEEEEEKKRKKKKKKKKKKCVSVHYFALEAVEMNLKSSRAGTQWRYSPRPNSHRNSSEFI